MAMFSVKREKPHITRFFPLLLMITALFLFICATGDLSSSNSAREEEIIATALDRSITQCYALEGAYPPDLAYLCDHYGFTYNQDHFFIDYQYIGSNLRPDVTIIKRESED